jgi:hypothetical protein
MNLVRWQSTLNPLVTACDCFEGKIGLVLCGGMYLLYLCVNPWSFHWSAWLKWGIGFGVACLGSLIGKLLGLFQARASYCGAFFSPRVSF